MNKYMRILVFFDLPTTSRTEQKAAQKFRRELLNDGYFMVQYSIYARTCLGTDNLQKHLNRIPHLVPNAGSVRALTLTEKQYQSMSIYLGEKNKKESPDDCGQLAFF